MIPSGPRPFFSVVINTYNYGCYIEEAIDSVLAQTFPQEQIEIVVVDDGSTDDTAERIKKYGDRILYLYKKNGGQSSAFNAGVAAAHGEIVAFLDSDDYWAPAKLQEVANEFSRSSTVDFVYHYLDGVDNDRHLLDRYVYPEPVREHYLEAYLGGTLPWFSSTSGMAVRKDCLLKVMPLPEEFSIAADIQLHYLLPFYMRELTLIKKSLGFCRLHGGNLSGGNLPAAEKLQRERRIMLSIRDGVQRLSRERGYDSHLLTKRLTALAAIYDIYILSVGGQMLRALTRALLYDDFLPDDTFLRRLVRRLTLGIAVLVPAKMNLWLQRKYRRIWYYFNRQWTP